MSEFEDIADTEFDELHALEHIDFGELDIVEAHTNRQAMSKELLGVVVVSADDTLSRLRMAHP